MPLSPSKFYLFTCGGILNFYVQLKSNSFLCSNIVICADYSHFLHDITENNRSVLKIIKRP
jgi:hypothetical protein